MAEFGPFSMQEVVSAFCSFDLDNNDYVGAAELRRVYQALGEEVTDEEVDEMIRMCDRDGDGQIDEDEFVGMIFRHASQRPDDPIEPQQSPPVQQASSPRIESRPQLQALPAPGPPRPHTASSATASYDSDGEMLADQDMNNQESDDRAFVLENVAKKLNIQGSQMNDIQAKFSQIDEDGSGEIDYDEFCSVMQMEPGPLAETLFKMFDSDGDGTIDSREFLVSMANLVATSKDQKVRFAFDVFDVDGSGSISRDELIKILKATHAHLASNESALLRKADAIMLQGDKDGDGEISYEEFVKVSKRFSNILFPIFKLAKNVSKNIGV